MIKLCILYISYKIRNVIYNNHPTYDPYYIQVIRVSLHSIYYKYLTQLLTLTDYYQYNKPPRHFIILQPTTHTSTQSVNM